jgi:DNA-binding transcriptional ArsR family regulator
VQLSKADAILHPVRMRIIQRLAEEAAGRRMTAQEIGAGLPDVPQATLYRHLGRLVDADVVEVVDQRQVRGTVERVYALRTAGAQLGPDEVARFTRGDHMRYFATFIAGLLGDFARYLERPTIDLTADGAGYRQVTFAATDEEMMELGQALNTVIVPVLQNGPAPGRKRRMLATVSILMDDVVEVDEESRKE